MEENGKIEIEIIRSRRRTIAVEVRPDGRVIVRAPHRMSRAQIGSFITDRREWIMKSLQKMEERRQEREQVEKLSPAELCALAEQAARDIPARVARFAPMVGVTCGKITIRRQRTRWGSCSSKGNLNFNCLLMLAPPEVRDYVVVHELCHRREMNHSPRFWALVEAVLPEYQTSRRWLRENGGLLMARADDTKD